VELGELIERQRRFDAKRSTNFSWSGAITEEDSRHLLHNVVSLAGEVGEIANLVKKLDRGDLEFSLMMEQIPEELADVMIYVIKIAYQSGIDLEKAVLEKMDLNETRFPQDSPERVPDAFGSMLFSRAMMIGANLDEFASGTLRQLYRNSGVAPPHDVSALVAGALLAIEVARLAELEGNGVMREAALERIEPLSYSMGLSEREIMDLARRDADLRNLLSSVGPILGKTRIV